MTGPSGPFFYWIPVFGARVGREERLVREVIVGKLHCTESLTVERVFKGFTELERVFARCY